MWVSRHYSTQLPQVFHHHEVRDPDTSCMLSTSPAHSPFVDYPLPVQVLSTDPPTITPYCWKGGIQQYYYPPGHTEQNQPSQPRSLKDSTSSVLICYENLRHLVVGKSRFVGCCCVPNVDGSETSIKITETYASQLSRRLVGGPRKRRQGYAPHSRIRDAQ